MSLQLEQNINFLPVKEADRLVIEYYTDPLCCWSWAFEQHWQRLLKEFSAVITYAYCMGGLIPDWKNYQDPMNDISRPAQLGPLWMEAAQITDAVIDPQIWVEDPPTSSYPACIAVKSAEMQSKEAGEKYLFKLREAVMVHKQNIAQPEVLAAIAQKFSKENPGLLDYNQFLEDISSEKSLELFRNDLQKVRYNRIGRFPTLTLHKPGQSGIMITGYRPYEVLLQAIQVIAPEILGNTAEQKG
ncbi:DsbA family protein [Mucilaginibacter arboris]|uniref:DsbA family protein n=1 Tax=Mucilaginibacter arboris TaxID=2682090 RepID=A0A7K1SVZ7_9SPHI|nr:DsbA family protein [Mucilaginibacter arboris]MVN21474.1 DsbA family protein [Mucilaginibacter arboris]